MRHGAEGSGMARVLALAAIAILAVGGEAAAQDMKFFRIASGAAGGIYFPMAGIIAQAISNPPGSRPCDRGGTCGVPGLVAIAQSANGSVANVAAIEAGDIESGFAQSDVTHWAFEGTGVFEGKTPMRNLRVIAGLYPEHLHVIATKASKVKSIAGFKRRTVGMGLPDSGVLVAARVVMEAAGLREKTDFTPEFLSIAHSAARLRLGEASGMVTITGYPNTAIAELFASTEAVLLPVDGTLRDRILKKHGFFADATIPAKTYMGVEKDVPTVSVTALWVTSAEQPEALIYDITRTLWNEGSRKLLDSGVPRGRDVTIESSQDGVTIPLHPGAERFYREAGVLQ